MTYTSGFLGSYIFGQRANPSLVFFEWDTDEPASPAGTRNIENGHAAFVKSLTTNTTEFAMSFEDIVLDFSDSIAAEYTSRIQCFTCHQNEQRFGVSNLRLWSPDVSALITSGHLEFAASGSWIYNAVMPSGSATAVPTALPTAPNIRRQDEVSYELNAAISDSNVSEFVYLGLTVPSGMPLGQYGVGSNGDLAFRVTYDWYDSFDIQDFSTPPPEPILQPYVDLVTSGHNATFSATELILVEPAAATDDLLIAIMTHGEVASNTVTPPDVGWTEIYSDNTPSIGAHMYYKRSNGTAPTGSWTFSSTLAVLEGTILSIKNAGDIVASSFRDDTTAPASTPAATGASAGIDNLILHVVTWQGVYGDNTLASGPTLEAWVVGSGHPQFKPIWVTSEIQTGDAVTTEREYDTTLFTWPDSLMGQIVIPYEAD